MTDRTIWDIKMHRDYGLAPIEHGYIAIGWREMGELSLIKPTREPFKAEYERASG